MRIATHITMDERLLHTFIRMSRQLTYDLNADCPLSELDQLRFENYLAMLQMTYVEWKQRNGRPTLANLVDPSPESYRDAHPRAST